MFREHGGTKKGTMGGDTSAHRDPIARLIADHEEFVLRLRTVREELERQRARPEGARVGAVAREFGRFLAVDVDRIHGRKEELGLFPALERYLPTDAGPLLVLVGEHQALRDLQAPIEVSGAKLESDPLATEAWGSFGRAVSEVDELLSFHIQKEDNVLFPLARELLTPKELDEVGAIFDSIDEERGPVPAPHDPWPRGPGGHGAPRQGP